MYVGIKFIPLRTPGGELIPGSGLFVQIKKTVVSVPKTSDRDAQEPTQDQQIYVDGEEIATVVDIEDKSCCSDEDTTSTEESFELESETSYYCVERMAKREEERRPTRRRFSTPASLMYTTNGNFKGSVQLNVIAEVNDDPEELNTTNNSHAADDSHINS
jgi:hypothetical protein